MDERECENCGDEAVCARHEDENEWLCRTCHREATDAICTCEFPTVTRTLGKGTPAERMFCICGGMIHGD